jgi:hypothetical protein
MLIQMPAHTLGRYHHCAHGRLMVSAKYEPTVMGSGLLPLGLSGLGWSYEAEEVLIGSTVYMNDPTSFYLILNDTYTRVVQVDMTANAMSYNRDMMQEIVR